MSDCGRGYYISHNEENDLGQIYTRKEWVSSCEWKPITTFLDKCSKCGKTFSYPNSNNYSEQEIKS